MNMAPIQIALLSVNLKFPKQETREFRASLFRFRTIRGIEQEYENGREGKAETFQFHVNGRCKKKKVT